MRVRPHISKWTFTLGALVGGVVIIGLLVFALYDWVTSAKASDQQVRQNTLSAELSNFLLATREPDGFSLLENARDFSKAERPLQFVELRKPFFAYLLNRQNARRLTADKIVWEAPRPCVVEFVKKAPQSSKDAPFSIQACIAVVPSEAVGRFAYFSIRYPVDVIRRHRPGVKIAGEDRVVIRFASAKVPPIVLVFRAPTLATSRYPSQIDRFAGIHEMSAFLANNPERPLRQVNAQAFEQVGEGDDSRNYVTIVGRIEGNYLDGAADSSEKWPTTAVSALQLGLEVYGHNQDVPGPMMSVPPGTPGRAQVSLQSAFLASVPSRSVLRVVRSEGGKEETIWTSENLNLPTVPRRMDWQQQVSDWWAQLLLKRYRSDPATYHAVFQLPAPNGNVAASLVAPPVALPAAATRAFAWLTAALVIVCMLVLLFVLAIFRLRSFTSLAWTMASNEIGLDDARARVKRRDEISTLWRVLTVLYRRNQANIRARVRVMHQAAIEREREVRVMHARLESRQERLAAIGHEITSPLATLLARTKGADETVQYNLRRMHNAIEGMLDAASVEDGIQNQKIVCEPIDLADFLRRLVENSNELMAGVVYDGPQAGVVCSIDEFYFETVVHHLLNNAVRYRIEGTSITIRLSVDEVKQDALVEVCNDGPGIPADRLKSIFQYRTSDSQDPRSRGLGLYAARSYLIAMRSTITAENRDNGVAFVILIPLA